jgi:hypothetical protein
MLKFKFFMFLTVLTLLVLCLSSVALSQTAKLIARWSLDEGSGDVVKDDVAGNDGKFVDGKLDWVNAKFGKGLEFTGKDIHVAIKKSPALESPDSVTLSAWVNFTKIDGRRDIVSYDDSYAIIIEGGVFKAFIHLGGGWPMASGTTPIKTGEWYFAAMTYDGTNVNIYVNGELDGSVAALGKIGYQNFELWFGGAPADPNQPWLFAGILDEVEIWSKAMTEVEIMNLYKSPPLSSAVDQKGKLAIAWGQLKSY